MKVLYVASEAYPFAKTGGLGDVAFSLPKALRAMGVDVRVIIPKYSQISPNYLTKMSHIASFRVPVGWRNQYCGLEHLCFEGIPFYFIDNEYYFKRDGCYGFFDDGERFSFFCRAVLESINYMDDFYPDIIHCNDWHTGMIPLLRQVHFADRGGYENIKTVFTIHNLKYQGIYSPSILGELLNLDMSYYNEQSVKFYDGVSFMKAGIVYSDQITTVSRSYAKEIQMPYYGEGLNGLLVEKNFKLKGILNGIDYDIYNPETDPYVYEKYNFDTYKKKTVNKTMLQEEFGMPVIESIPMIGVVTRLVRQKGLDLITGIMDSLLKLDVQICMLGSGDDDYRDFFEYYANAYPSKLHVYIGYNEELARKIYAASDIFLMPSQFEPCGIGQLIAMKYGSVPIVRETGGLRDTIVPYNEFTGEGTGFSFANYNAHEMFDTISYALEQYRKEEVWYNLIKKDMEADFSWTASAKEYIEMYESM